ncbi:hypothetical protein Acr_07g0012010 [Actinidia rufa]|uniref:Uncharacterized protein n=1 Tax=Actinidia rufa TaxID=165716 RepID=A0A7J0EX12_9ERIC|nr:hypothetical protein Acr_07g0012010 [Actinidia rufa]
MPPRQSRDRARPLLIACGTRGAGKVHGDHEEGDGENHLESVIGGANAPRGNVGGGPLAAFGGAEFMQGMFTTIKQVVRNTVQAMQVLIRVIDTRVTTAMKAFLQFCSPTFRGNLIKVYSTMASSATANKETLNETRKILNPKSQSDDGTSTQSEGRYSKKPKIFTSQQYWGIVLQSAHIRVNSSDSLSRGDIPTVRLKSSHRVEGHLFATNVVKLAMSCGNAHTRRAIKER